MFKTIYYFLCDFFYQLDKKILPYAAAAAAAKSLQSCPTLCDPIDGSSQGSPIPGILQARTLEWVAISFSNAWEPCPTLHEPMDGSLPGSSVNGIFQARALERGTIAFSIPYATIWQIFDYIWFKGFTGFLKHWHFDPSKIPLDRRWRYQMILFS